MAKGGKRPGAGRPKGSTNVPRFADYVTDEDRQTFYEFVRDSYMGDMGLAKYFGEHAFRKLPTEVTGEDGGALLIQFDGAFTPGTKKDSQ